MKSRCQLPYCYQLHAVTFAGSGFMRVCIYVKVFVTELNHNWIVLAVAAYSLEVYKNHILTSWQKKLIRLQDRN